MSYNLHTEVYEIDSTFVADLKADGFAPLSLDSARLDPQTSGYYKLAGVATGDLADAMGLQSNDILKSVNGYDLGSASNQTNAYTALEGETQFVLDIERGGQTVRLSYELVN